MRCPVLLNECISQIYIIMNCRSTSPTSCYPWGRSECERYSTATCLWHGYRTHAISSGISCRSCRCYFK